MKASLARQPFFVGAVKKPSGHCCMVFEIKLNYIIHRLFADKMLCLLCSSVLRPEQRRRLDGCSLRSVSTTLLKLIDNNSTIAEVFTRSDSFLCRPCVRTIESIERLHGEGLDIKEGKNRLCGPLKPLMHVVTKCANEFHWLCQHSSSVHENHATVTRRRFFYRPHKKRLARETM